MSNSIVPTVGRKVWYWDSGQGPYDAMQPFDATVIYVWNPDCVNLRVTNHAGTTSIQTNVPLRDYVDGDNQDGVQRCATWMPYQTGQAKKA